jgi:hypothetical protein
MALGLVDQAYPIFTQIRQSSTENLRDIEKLDTVIKYCRQVLGIQD